MTKKDTALYKKCIVGKDGITVTSFSVCYADTYSKELKVLSKIDLKLMPETMQDLFISLIKKAVSGKPYTTALEMVPQTGLMEDLRGDDFADASQTVFEAVFENLPADDSYLILAGKGNLSAFPDVPYSFFSVVPCPLSKDALFYSAQKEDIEEDAPHRLLTSPTHSFAFPAIINGEPDAGKVMCFFKSTKIAEESGGFIESIFHASPQWSATEQKDAFQVMLSAGYNMGYVPYDAAKGVIAKLDEMILQKNISGNSGDAVTAGEVADLIIECGKNAGVDADQVRKMAEEFSSSGFVPSNLVGKDINVETDTAAIRIQRQDLDLMRKDVINGEECYIIPAKSVRVDDIPVK